jgi:hypothetical protein
VIGNLRNEVAETLGLSSNLKGVAGSGRARYYQGARSNYTARPCWLKWPDLHTLDLGWRAPVEDRTLRAGLYNLSLNNTREDIIRAFLEGIAFNTRWLLALVEIFLGQSVNTINIVGGGAQNERHLSSLGSMNVIFTFVLPPSNLIPSRSRNGWKKPGNRGAGAEGPAPLFPGILSLFVKY